MREAGRPKFSGLMSDKTRLATYMGILMPNVFVAPIRYFVMRENPDVRYRLFMRDVLAAAAGVGSFYATLYGSKAVLGKTLMKSKPAADVTLAATFAGWVANVIVQGYGAVRMSEWMSKRQQEKLGNAPAAEENKPEPLPVPPPTFKRTSPQRVETPVPAQPAMTSSPALGLPAALAHPPSLEDQRYFRSARFIPAIAPPPVYNPFALQANRPF